MKHKRIRTVLVGCGGISRAWLNTETVRKQVELVGFVDIRKKAALQHAAEWGVDGAVVGTDLKTVLNATNPDAVFDCTIPEAHCGVTLTALKHGCHVLGEKPMADSMANARKMVVAAAKYNRIYAVIQNRRYQPQIRAIQKFIKSGAIGQVTTVQSSFFLGAHFGGFRDRMEHVLLLDMAIHTFDAARMISGVDAESVYCHEWNPAGSWYDHGASAVAIFQMNDGVVYTYEGSWCAEGCATSWECSWRIVGTKGTILWDGADGISVEVLKKQGGFISQMKPRKIPVKCAGKLVGGHAGVIGAFIDAVRSGTQPETVCTDNVQSLAMVHGAIASAEKGRRVSVE